MLNQMKNIFLPKIRDITPDNTLRMVLLVEHLTKDIIPLTIAPESILAKDIATIMEVKE